MLRKPLSAVLSLLFIVLLAVPAAALGTVTSPENLKGSSYTDIPVLIEKLDSVFSGDIGLFSDAACTKPVSAAPGTSSVPLWKTYYILDESSGTVYSGTSCYIYANAVYNRLFCDVAYHGWSDVWEHSLAVAGNETELTYELFTGSGVRTGAILRTTPNIDGSYNSDSGHSVVILSYSDSSVTYIEGNADGRGLIRVITRTWDDIQYDLLTRRGYRLSFIVQPTDAYYESLMSYDIHPYFSDVAGWEWYASDVSAAAELGLINGRDGGRFCPSAHMTVAEAVTLAARIRSLCLSDEEAFFPCGENWYSPFCDYLLTSCGYDCTGDMGSPISRSDFASMLCTVLPEYVLLPVMSPTRFSDVAVRDSAPGILSAAGIVKGCDGLFHPGDDISRCEAAAIAVRCAEKVK